MEDQLDEVQSLNRELEGNKVGLERQLRDLEEQLKDVKSERERTSKDLQEKKEILGKLEKVHFPIVLWPDILICQYILCYLGNLSSGKKGGRNWKIW